MDVNDFEINITNNETDKYIYAGAVTGYISSDANAIISECMFDGKINITAENVYCGGIAGYAQTETSGTCIIKNCISSVDIETFAAENSYTGGICGAFYSNSNNLSNIDSCYFSGKITTEANNSSFAGGISGSILSLSDEINVIKNCFITSPKIESISPNTSYAGYIFSNKNQYANISNCYTSIRTVLFASQITENTNVASTNLSKFYNDNFIDSNVGLDIQNTWHCNGTSLPSLSAFRQEKNVFEIKSFAFENDGCEFNAAIDIKYRTQSAYTVLAAAYNERGKMISFSAKTVYNPQEFQTIIINLKGIENATSCTVSVINPFNLQFLEDAMKISK